MRQNKSRFLIIILATLLFIGLIHAWNQGLFPAISLGVPTVYEPHLISDDDLIAIEATVRAGVMATVEANAVDQGSSLETTVSTDAEHGYTEISTTLPGLILDIIPANGGRYFVLKMESITGLGIYDAQSQTLIHTIRLDSDNFLYTAGGNIVLVYYPVHNILQTWSLETFEKLRTKPNPKGATITRLTMGHSNSQRALVRYAVGTSALDRANMYILDVDKLEIISGDTDQLLLRNSVYRDEVQQRANGQLRLVSEWKTSASPTGLGAHILSEDSWTSSYEHTSVGYVAVGDDDLVYTGNGRILNSQLTRIGTIDNARLIPAINGSFFLSVSNSGLIQLYTSGSTTPIVAIGQFPDPDNILTDPFRTDRRYPLDRRVFFLPNEGIILLVPPENNRIIHRSFDLLQQLERLGVDYLTVVSIPNPITFVGDRWQYQLEVLSNSRISKYHLEFGPEGMTISNDGLLAWQVPAGYSGNERVVVLIENDNNDSSYHSFDLQIREGR